MANSFYYQDSLQWTRKESLQPNGGHLDADNGFQHCSRNSNRTENLSFITEKSTVKSKVGNLKFPTVYNDYSNTTWELFIDRMLESPEERGKSNPLCKGAWDSSSKKRKTKKKGGGGGQLRRQRKGRLSKRRNEL